MKFDRFNFELKNVIRQDNLFLVVSGSHAYGWNTVKSDLDLRYVYFPKLSHVLSIDFRGKPFEYKEGNNGEIDCTVYPIQSFLRLLAKGNGNSIDNLFQASGSNSIFYKKEEVEKLQDIVMRNLHVGVIDHCLGYDESLIKDLNNEVRIARYGKKKLLLCRYKILLEGNILADYGNVVYNLREQQSWIKTKHCIPLLDSYLNTEYIEDYNPQVKEIDKLRFRLKTTKESLKLSNSNENLKLQLDSWLLNHYEIKEV